MVEGVSKGFTKLPGKCWLSYVSKSKAGQYKCWTLWESLNPVSIKLTSHHLLSTLLVNTVCVSRKRVFQTFRQPDKPGSQDENWNRNWNWKLVKPRHENRNIDRNRDRNWTTQVKTSEPGCWDSPTCTARLRQGIKSLKKKIRNSAPGTDEDCRPICLLEYNRALSLQQQDNAHRLTLSYQENLYKYICQTKTNKQTKSFSFRCSCDSASHTDALPSRKHDFKVSPQHFN